MRGGAFDLRALGELKDLERLSLLGRRLRHAGDFDPPRLRELGDSIVDDASQLFRIPSLEWLVVDDQTFEHDQLRQIRSRDLPLPQLDPPSTDFKFPPCPEV